MALGVDVFRLNATGQVIWRHMGRWWDGHKLLDLLGDRLEPAEPPPSWECDLAANEVRELAERFDPPDLRSRYPDDPDLGELLTRPETRRIVLRIEEWGYG